MPHSALLWKELVLWCTPRVQECNYSSQLQAAMTTGKTDLEVADTPGSSRLEALLSLCQVTCADHKRPRAAPGSPRAECQLMACSSMHGAVCQHSQVSCVIPLSLTCNCLHSRTMFTTIKVLPQYVEAVMQLLDAVLTVSNYIRAAAEC